MPDGPMRSRSADSEHGRRRDRERPPPPEPLPHPVVDNHCHLDISDGDWLETGEAIARASTVGVPRIVQIGCDLPGAAWAVQAARDHAALVAGVALHPNEAPRLAADGRLDEGLAEIERLARAHDKVRAVGETGLDFFRTGEDGREAQIRSFEAHIAIAKDHDLALQIHDRDAHDDVLRVLRRVGAPKRTVFHCFSGDAEFAKEVADAGWYLSFAGTVTFKNAGSLRDALEVIPRASILIETDAPYLTPTPWRGRPNSSYLIPHTLRFMAEHLGTDPSMLAAQISSNTEEVYGSWDIDLDPPSEPNR